MEGIISGAISGLVTLCVCLITNKAHEAKTMALLEYQLSELSRRVEKHNSVVERVYRLEGQVKAMEGGGQ